MENGAKTRWGEYAIAAAIVAVAMACRLALDQFLPGRLPFITFFPALIASAYLCSLPTSIVVLLISAVVGAYGFSPLAEHDVLYRALAGAVFLLVGGVMIYLVSELKKAREKSLRHEEQLELINRELKHRLKNLFTISASICTQTIKSGASPDEMARAVAGRIHAIASAQDTLSVTSAVGADVASLSKMLLTNLAPAPDKLFLSGPPAVLPADVTTPFALVLHELGTNSLKYGAWSDNGRVEATWAVSGGLLKFGWHELDGPRVAPPIREGLGSALIKRGLPKAKVEHDFKPEGLQCRIELPL
jgi:two-component sensor histidine kinase